MAAEPRPAHVAARRKGEETGNTLVLQVIDLVLPLELDLDDDPHNPDTVRLRRQDGAYQVQLRADDPAVERDGDNDLLLYHFEDVPVGTYAVEVLVDRTWAPVLDAVTVAASGVTRGGDSLVDEDFDGSQLGVPEEEWEEDDEDEEEERAIEEEEQLDGHDPYLDGEKDDD